MPSFYDSAKWKATRARVLKRDGYMCRECRKYGRMREAKIVHHIEHLDEHPEKAFDMNNLVSLCMACHDKAHPEKGTYEREKHTRPSF